jgi:hypothetical protein
MKNILILFALAFIISCKKDSACEKADFIGTWVGTEKCTLTPIVDIEIVIAESGDKISIKGGFLFDDSSKVDECDLDGGTAVFGLGSKITGTLNGKNLNYSHSNGIGAAAITCDYNLTKK